jgi:hypothetical protein
VKETRLNLRLEAELVEWLKMYCARKKVTMSGLVRQLLVKEKEEDELLVEAEQV